MQRNDPMTVAQSWSIEHIRQILSRLDKNHVTIPIQSNGFEETRALEEIYQISEDPFTDFDEFTFQSKAPSSNATKATMSNSLLMIVHCLMQNVNLNNIQLFITTLKMYIDATLVKDLHITKHKLTKKKLKEDLDSIDRNIHNNVWVKDNCESMLKSLLLAFSRCYGCNIHIEGLCKLYIEVPNANNNIHLKLTEGGCTYESN